MFSADSVAEQFGVVKASYDSVPTLPPGSAPAAVPALACGGAGLAGRVLALEAQVGLAGSGRTGL